MPPGPFETGSLTTTGRRSATGMWSPSTRPPGGEADRSLLDTLPDTRDEIGTFEARTASQKEIQEFGASAGQVSAFPFPMWRTTAPGRNGHWPPAAGCWTAPGPTRSCWRSWWRPGRLPMSELAAGSGTDKKTMERHRKYLVAILLAFTNGYEIIRGHLCQITPAKGGDGKMSYSSYGDPSGLRRGAG